MGIIRIYEYAKAIPLPLLSLSETLIATIIPPCLTGRGAVRLARLHGVQEVPGSIPGAPTGDRLHTLFEDVSGLRSQNTHFFLGLWIYFECK